MISVSGVSMRYGSKVLFEVVTTTFSPGRRYGLTGPNGSGKSTFMKLLTGALDPQKGSVARPPKLGVLRQDQFAFDRFRVLDTVIMGHANRIMKMADVKEYADFNRGFLDHVRAAKKAGQSVEEAIKWTVPERFLKSGYNQPMPDALRSNAQVIWNELK